MDGMITNSRHNVSDAGLYTDFSGLAKLRAQAANQSDLVRPPPDDRGLLESSF